MPPQNLNRTKKAFANIESEWRKEWEDVRGMGNVLPGWKTREQIAKDMNMSLGSAKNAIKALLDAGRCERRSFMARDALGRLTPMIRFKIIKNGTKPHGKSKHRS